MPNKKHYWTQIFVVTTLVSCGLGFASGFVWGESGSVASQTKDVAYIQLETALRNCTYLPYQSFCDISPLAQPGATIVLSTCPIIQPGAKVIDLEPYYANRISAPPYGCDAWKYEPPAGAVQGKNFKIVGAWSQRACH